MLFGFKFTIGVVLALVVLWVAWQIFAHAVLVIRNVRIPHATGSMSLFTFLWRAIGVVAGPGLFVYVVWYRL